MASWLRSRGAAPKCRLQYDFLALRAEWHLTDDRPQQALDAIEQALQITNKLGTPSPGFHDLRAWALARLGRTADAHAELEAGEQRLFAAETHLVLNEPDRALRMRVQRLSLGLG